VTNIIYNKFFIVFKDTFYSIIIIKLTFNLNYDNIISVKFKTVFLRPILGTNIMSYNEISFLIRITSYTLEIKII